MCCVSIALHLGIVKVTLFPILYPADAASLYMLSSGDAQLFEVKAFDEDFHSWFVGQTVQRGWSLSFLQCELKSNQIITANTAAKVAHITSQYHSGSPLLTHYQLFASYILKLNVR